MIKIQIKNRILGTVLFEYEKDNNTIKDTVVEAIKQCAYLSGADLRGAYLSGADLRGAYLKDADLKDADLSGAYLSGAYLKDADLRGADLKDADLRGADLSGADLSGADLRGAYLKDADLSGAYLSGAYLKDADLRDADLRGADLSGADLRGADLKDADLKDADLSGADLKDAKEVPFIPFACPSDGAFIAWKKIKFSNIKGNHNSEDLLIKLLIPEDARRCSSTSSKCRCDKAMVLDIMTLDESKHLKAVTNTNYKECRYEVGKEVIPDSFDENRFNECSNGIHFFINKQEAINYE